MDPVHERYERRRFTADEVWRMVEVGLLRADERVELIDGELVMVPPQGPEHADITMDLVTTLQAAFGAAFSRVRTAQSSALRTASRAGHRRLSR